MAKAEYDLTDSWTVYSALGGQHSHEIGTYSAPKLLNKNGDATVGRLDTNRIIDAISGMGGVRGDFNTGAISHKGEPRLCGAGAYRCYRLADVGEESDHQYL